MIMYLKHVLMQKYNVNSVFNNNNDNKTTNNLTRQITQINDSDNSLNNTIKSFRQHNRLF